MYKTVLKDSKGGNITVTANDLEALTTEIKGHLSKGYKLIPIKK